MTRAVAEWIGKTADTKIPPRVRLRIFERENGVCHLCQQPIQAGQKWEANHDPALINSGENRESKIFPAHVACHQVHTREAKAEKAKVAAIRQRHLGITRPTGKLRSPPFQKSEKAAKREKAASTKQPLKPRPMFGRAGER